MNEGKLVLGVTIGDPAGIGPEITLKALAGIKTGPEIKFVLFGDEPVLKRTGLPVPEGVTVVSSGIINNQSFTKGKVSSLTGKAAYRYFSDAISFLEKGKIKALVTAPVSKEAINLAGFKFRGHTEVLAEKFGAVDYGMLFSAGRFRLLLLTTHLPLSGVSEEITADLIFRKVRLADRFLKSGLGLRNPKILVCGLNPHAGEGGYLGKEEAAIFKPAIALLLKEGVAVSGPVSADSAYRIYRGGGFHLMVSAYHDQMLPLFKALYFNQGVNVTIGLPVIRTSPDHGTAFDLAYKNIANSRSMEAAIKLALRLS
ncbi:MAG: 4-hydroxythreonine-4-phosphate dehydrogenase PdxA [Candidatus Omnitrophica bacterium]|nr:4-hydroxythreonine-4-phosphate dehydrogenase PdxA [Candidatus Omnitrophota bacterium]